MSCTLGEGLGGWVPVVVSFITHTSYQSLVEIEAWGDRLLIGVFVFE